jgi:beta-lactamase class A
LDLQRRSPLSAGRRCADPDPGGGHGRDGGRPPAPTEIISVRDVDLSPPPSTVADAWPGRQTWSVAELQTLARNGDATALDLLTKRVGGPGGVNGWLDVQRLVNVSVDRYRRQLATDGRGLPSFRAAWKGEAAWRQAVNSVPRPTAPAPLRSAAPIPATQPRRSA